MERYTKAVTITSLIAILEIMIMATAALPQGSFLISSQGAIRYPFVGNPWEVRSFVAFPYTYQFSKIGTDDPYSYEVLLDALVSRFGDPRNGGAVNTIDVRVYWTNDGGQVPGASPTTPKIYQGASGGESSFENVAKGIEAIRAKGFKVLLGFPRDWEDGTGATLDASTWLSNHKSNIIEVAKFAEANGVDFFHIAWEDVINSRDLQNGSLDAIWKDIISEVRAVYSGLVSYETNWWPTEYWYDEEGIRTQKPWLLGASTWENTWWRDLDYIAISTYWQSSDDNYDPTVDFLIDAWYENYADGRPGWNISEMYRDLSEHYGKRLLINIGYPSCEGANIRPWFPRTSTLDWQEQANCWEAFFRVWSKADFLLGADLEHFTKPWPPVEPEAGWEYQYRSNFGGKDAETVIRTALEAVA